ncbi:MAG TPA: hypothetical protein VF043_08890, partial [Ktedonobacteraceae bacterium]
MNPLAFVGLHSSLDARRALSAADVGARAPSWNDEAGFGTDLARALPQCSAHLRLRSRVPLGRDERLVGRVGRAFAGCDGGSGQDGFCRWAEGTGPRLPCPGAGGRTDERRGSQAHRAMVVGRKMDNERVSPPLQ